MSIQFPTIPNLEQYRQSGRTYRMFADMYRTIKESDGKKLVLLVMANQTMVDWAKQRVNQDYPLVQASVVDAYIHANIEVLTLSQAMGYINWQKMEPYKEDQYRDHALFVDHEAIEKVIRAAYAVMTKYDPS